MEQQPIAGVTDGNSQEEQQRKRKRNPLEHELSCTRRVIEAIEELGAPARARVLNHVSHYFATNPPADQTEFGL